MMENENRLIYANVAIEKCNKLLDNGYSCPNPDALEGVKIVRNLILSECETGCPTVDAVEVVHAGWKNGDCTACGFDIRDMIDGESEFRSWIWECVPYCPHCGAKMDGGNEDE